MKQLIEARNKFTAKQKEFGEWCDRAKDSNGDYDPSKVGMTGQKFFEEYKAKDKEVNELFDEMTKWAELDKSESARKQRELGSADHGNGHRQPEEGADGKKEAKSIGKLLVESKAYSERGRGGSAGVTAMIQPGGLKDIFRRTAGWTPEERRSGLLVLDAQRPIQVTDLIPTTPWSSDVYRFMEETTFTNNAGEIVEGSATTFGEAVLVVEEQSQNVQKIAVYIPVTDEQMEDVAQAEAYVNQRLPFMVQQKLDAQILNGNGTAPNLLGVVNKSGVQTQARGTDNGMDAIHKALTKVRVTGRAMPNAIIMHSDDWQYLRLTRTIDGIYILGNPGDNAAPRLWGLPIVQQDSLTAGTTIVGDFANYSLLAERSGMDVQVGFVNDYFIRGIKAIRATVRVAVVWTRAAAFCKVTSMQS